MSKELTLKERELLCSQKGATWNLPFKHEIADKWRIPKFSDELTLEQIEYLKQNKIAETVAEKDRIITTENDRQVFFDAVSSNTKPNKNLEAAAKRLNQNKEDE